MSIYGLCGYIWVNILTLSPPRGTHDYRAQLNGSFHTLSVSYIVPLSGVQLVQALGLGWEFQGETSSLLEEASGG